MAYQKQIYQDGITEYTDTLFEHMDDGIFGAYPVQLIAISDTAPSQCVENDKYYNTSTKKIYTATGTNTWGSTGTTPLEDTSYWLISENGNYAWDGTDLVSIGGGKAEVIISDTEPEEGKLWVDTGEIQVVAGKENLVNVGLSVDSSFKTNIIHSKNLYLPFTKNATGSGISLVVNSDKSITLTGTNSSASTYDFYSHGDASGSSSAYYSFKIPNGKYTLSGAGANTSSKYILYAVFLDSNGNSTIVASGETKTLTDIVGAKLFVRVLGNATLNDTIYPMLNSGETALPYEPYVVPSIVVDNDEIYSKPSVKDYYNDITLNTTNVNINSNNLHYYKKRSDGLIVFTITLSAKVAMTSGTAYDLFTIPSDVNPTSNFPYIVGSYNKGYGVAYIQSQTRLMRFKPFQNLAIGDEIHLTGCYYQR